MTLKFLCKIPWKKYLGAKNDQFCIQIHVIMRCFIKGKHCSRSSHEIKVGTWFISVGLSISCPNLLSRESVVDLPWIWSVLNVL